MVTYIEADAAPYKNTGVIRLYGPEGFEGMRKACQVTARCLDELVARVSPGVTTDEIDRFVFEFGMDHGALLQPSIIAATRNLPAPRSITWSVTASPTTSRCAGTSSIST